MKYLVLILLYSCSQVSTRPPLPSETDQVSLQATLNHIRASYLKGCVDVFRDIHLPIAFETCRERADIHVKEVQGIIDYTP